MPIPATKSQADIIQNFQLNSGPLFNARNPIHLAPFSIFPTINTKKHMKYFIRYITSIGVSTEKMATENIYL